LEMAWAFETTFSDTLLPTRLYLLILPRQLHHLWIKHLIKHVSLWRPFLFKPPQNLSSNSFGFICTFFTFFFFLHLCILCVAFVEIRGQLVGVGFLLRPVHSGGLTQTSGFCGKYTYLLSQLLRVSHILNPFVCCLDLCELDTSYSSLPCSLAHCVGTSAALPCLLCPCRIGLSQLNTS